MSNSNSNSNNSSNICVLLAALLLCCLTSTATAFAPVPAAVTALSQSLAQSRRVTLPVLSADNGNGNREDPNLQQKFGGFTVKQRLREEVESPFRTVRLAFFGVSSGSALLALYFSATAVLKANMGLPGAAPLDESLQSCAINVIAVLVCGSLTYRDWQAGQANLKRIAKGGALASLQVVQVTNKNGNDGKTSLKVSTMSDYRRNARVLIAAGGPEYIATLARSLNSDQLKDDNNLPQLLEQVEVIVVPVLLEGNDASRIGNTLDAWQSTTTADPEKDRNFDINRSNAIAAFPTGNDKWFEYLESEITTATSQGFNVMEKGFTITVKKNGRILRRATGQPQWSGLIETMEVMDGSKFGMPGDSEKYGGP